MQEPLSTAFTLPAVTKTPVMLQPLSATNRVMMIGLTSDELSLIQMSVLARWNITPKLLGVEGVANIAVWGNRERQLQVQVDPELLRANGVSLDQVISTTGDSLWVFESHLFEGISTWRGRLDRYAHTAAWDQARVAYLVAGRPGQRLC